MAAEVHQRSFAELRPDPGWASNRPPPLPELPPLSEGVRAELDRFRAALVASGRVKLNSAGTYRSSLAQAARQAERHLGRPLASLEEVYSEEMIAALAPDDAAPSGTGSLCQPCKAGQRVALGAYLWAVRLKGHTFKEARAILDRGFRRAARRDCCSYSIGAGRPTQEQYLPPREDIERFLEGASRLGNAFAGPRLAAAVAVAYYHGLRLVSVEHIDGTNFQWRHGTLFLMYTEKTVRHKQEEREIEVTNQGIPYLARYEAAHNADPTRTGWRGPVGRGLPGPYLRSLEGGRWRGPAIRSAFLRCCQALGITPFSPHALRHRESSELAAVLPMEEAATADGRKNDRVLGRCYARSLINWQPRLPLDEPPLDWDDDGRSPSPAGMPEEEVFTQ